MCVCVCVCVCLCVCECMCLCVCLWLKPQDNLLLFLSSLFQTIADNSCQDDDAKDDESYGLYAGTVSYLGYEAPSITLFCFPL